MLLQQTMSDQSISYDYVFGFGSIMDTSTHATWQTSESSAPMPGSIATISKRFGYQRQWNFRSSTGFTALGVSKADREGESCGINGVLFQVPTDEMPNFDRRENGYERVTIPLNMMTFHPELIGSHSQTPFQLLDTDRIWMYVPIASHTMFADENHPLLQSYVDTVLRGCLEWGGEIMAEQFIEVSNALIHTWVSTMSYLCTNNETTTQRHKPDNRRMGSILFERYTFVKKAMVVSKRVQYNRCITKKVL
jgi:cation transport regulator ChaC